MGTTKFYQTEWNGISLVDISEKLGKNEREVANTDFYAMFYSGLKERNWNLDKDWIEDKKQLGNIVFQKIHPAPDDRIISLGAGLGICEMEAIQAGYNVELQEVQADSFKYLDKTGVKPSRKWVTGDFSELPSNYYDYVIMNHIVYCFNDREYRDLLRHVRRILKTNGRLILTAEYLSERECIRNNISNSKWLRKLFGKENVRVFWGYLRTVRRHAAILGDSFDIIKHGQLGNENVTLEYSYYLCKRK